MKLQPYRPHIIHQKAHRIKRINNISLMMQKPNPRWDFHAPPDHIMVEPNLSSAIHPCAIFQTWMRGLIEHVKPNHPGIPEANHLNPSYNDSNSRTGIKKPSSYWSIPKPSKAPECLFHPGLQGLVSQPTKGFQSLFRPSLPGLVTQPKLLQGFHELVT